MIIAATHLISQPLYPFLQHWYVKVHQQAHWGIGQFHIGEQLRLMYPKQPLDALKLEDQPSLHQDINPVSILGPELNRLPMCQVLPLLLVPVWLR